MSVPHPGANQSLGLEQQREWWRWHFAGQIAASVYARAHDGIAFETIASEAVAQADALIAALEANR